MFPALYLHSVCGVCGHVLEKNVLSTEGHLRLLEQVEQHLMRSVDTFENNRKEREELLAFRRMISSEPPPLAVLDGLNIAYQRQRGWRQVGPLAGGCSVHCGSQVWLSYCR